MTGEVRFCCRIEVSYTTHVLSNFRVFGFVLASGIVWTDAPGNFGASEQWAGRVCSVICQVHTNIFLPVQTGPIDHGYTQRAVCRIPALRLAHAFVKDWPSLLQWVCSAAHRSCQRRYTCRQKSRLRHGAGLTNFGIVTNYARKPLDGAARVWYNRHVLLYRDEHI